MTRIRIMTIQ